MKKVIFIASLLFTAFAFSQEETPTEEVKKSNIQEFTPSKLLNKGQWDIKWFNNLYTQTERTDERSNSVTVDRETYLTTSLEVFTGISKNRRFNVGLIAQVRSNTFNGKGALDVLSFKNDKVDSRSGLTTIAPSLKIQPFKSIGNFSLQTSFYFPLFKDEPNAPYLDKRSYVWETKFFYDKTFANDKLQFFGEVDFAYNFGEHQDDVARDILGNELENSSERFANNSAFVPISAFLSYLPSSKATIYINAQQAFLIDGSNDFAQNYSLAGIGGKYQVTEVMNLEVSFAKFLRGNNFQGLGQAFNLGARFLL